MSEKEVYALYEVAGILGMTESAFRGQLNQDKKRQHKAMPQPFTRLGKRLAWRKRDVELWLEGSGEPPSKPTRKRGRGRPAKVAR